MQFALIRSAPTIEDKAATIVDHLCQKKDGKGPTDELKRLAEKKFKQTTEQSEGMPTMHRPMQVTDETSMLREGNDNALSGDGFLDDKHGKKRPAATLQASDATVDGKSIAPPQKIMKGLRYKLWNTGALQPAVKFKKQTDKQITEVSLFFYQQQN